MLLWLLKQNGAVLFKSFFVTLKFEPIKRIVRILAVFILLSGTFFFYRCRRVEENKDVTSGVLKESPLLPRQGETYTLDELAKKL